MIVNPNTLPAPVQKSMDDNLLSVRTPTLIHKSGAITKRMPSKGGNTLRMSRYDRLPTAPVPLGKSGETPPPVVPERVDIDAKIDFYGQWIAVNQQVTLQNQDPVLNEFSELLGLSLRMTEDQLTRDMLASTANKYNCTGGGNGDMPTEMTTSDTDQVTSALITNDAWTILQSVGAEDKFGTAPTRDAYLALAHSKLVPDINNLTDFVSKWNYANQQSTIGAEWGTARNVRFFVSSQGQVKSGGSGLGNDLFTVFVQGMEALACVEQDNYSARFLYRPAQFSDPLFQNVSLGYVFAETPKILNDLWITAMQCTLRKPAP